MGPIDIKTWIAIVIVEPLMTKSISPYSKIAEAIRVDVVIICTTVLDDAA